MLKHPDTTTPTDPVMRMSGPLTELDDQELHAEGVRAREWRLNARLALVDTLLELQRMGVTFIYFDDPRVMSLFYYVESAEAAVGAYETELLKRQP